MAFRLYGGVPEARVLAEEMLPPSGAGAQCISLKYTLAELGKNGRGVEVKVRFLQ